MCQPLKNRYLALAFLNDQELEKGVQLANEKMEEEDELLELTLMC